MGEVGGRLSLVAPALPLITPAASPAASKLLRSRAARAADAAVKDNCCCRRSGRAQARRAPEGEWGGGRAGEQGRKTFEDPRER